MYNEKTNTIDEIQRFNNYDEENDIIDEFDKKDKLSAIKRRKTNIKKKQKEIRQVTQERGGYFPGPNGGYVDHELIDGQWIPTGKYVKYPKNSNIQKGLKRRTHKKNRQFKIDEDSYFGKGNAYRKSVDYGYELW